jgi:hypothetical protein
MLPGHRNDQLGRSRLSDVLKGEWPRELVICLQDILKNDFGKVDEVIFQGVERPYDLIFCILGIGKIDLDEFAYVMF